MQSAYSWMGSRIHLVLEDEVAEAYNRAQDKFGEAQKRHQKIHGHEWGYKHEALEIDWEPAEQKAFNDIASVINLLVEINGEGGLDIPEEEITSDYLIKL